ncbi:MAG: GlsB/YeaQ/YmgE family stress response membrane protein [Planctomycetota bacterium]|nr:GlsB/YeaQ/YmgE family stress response membrane protein [Planctomycetota bacterium]MCB9825349.1 GlsB/YeaQ/YmgE family stress response membrane protein [Planctomycetota bacterium]MCB9900831.1 GlsB/YeaQ/YmgE family stress response membrane protein [Planctomycetota bacterium]
MPHDLIAAAYPFDSIEHTIVFLVIGGLIGWLASILMKTNGQMGLLANILVGVAGAYIGGWLGGVLGISVSGWVGAALLALGGAVLLIIVLRFLRVLK